MRYLVIALAGTLLLAGCNKVRARTVRLATTTSTENSGLLDVLLPAFEERTGIDVQVMPMGTGKALRTARDGNCDVVLVHAPEAEARFVAEGWGLKRHDVMYNDFVIVGPASDPAGIAALKDADEALEKIAKAETPFASRGDGSGTHRAEQKLWQDASVDAKKSSGVWYLETGSGMGATLNTAVGKHAYTLTDLGTWLSFENKGDFKVLVEGDPKLFNQYGGILVNPAKHPNVKADDGQAFVDWLISSDGQAAIASYKIDGKQLFFPNARPGA